MEVHHSIPIALRLVYKSQLFSHFRVAGWVTLYRLIHSQSTLSFLFSNCPSLLQFDRVQFVERAYREVSITTKLLIAWFTSTRGVYQMRTVKPVHFFRAKESLLIEVLHKLCISVQKTSHFSLYYFTSVVWVAEGGKGHFRRLFYFRWISMTSRNILQIFVVLQ